MIIKIDIYAHMLAYDHAPDYNIFLTFFYVLKYRIYMIFNLQIPLNNAKWVSVWKEDFLNELLKNLIRYMQVADMMCSIVLVHCLAIMLIYKYYMCFDTFLYHCQCTSLTVDVLLLEFYAHG
jgi:hypothetical protein